MTVLEVKMLSKAYGDIRVLGDVTFRVKRGEILGLIGPNGSGKTTLMEGVAGLIPVDAGTVIKNEVPFYVPEGMLPYRDQFVQNVIGYFAEVFGADPSAVSGIVADLELDSVLKKRVIALSKGYRRRLLIAVGLLSNRPLLLLDEPFDGLDHRQTMSVVKLLKKVSAEKTLFLAIHQLSDAERICDRFLLLSSGKIVAEGTLTELQTKARMPGARLEEVFLALT